MKNPGFSMETGILVFSLVEYRNNPMLKRRVYGKIYIMRIDLGGFLMYCHQCGEDLNETSRFCVKCGANVQDKIGLRGAIEQEGLPSGRVEKASKGKIKRLYPVLIPMLTLIIFSSGLTLYFFYEKGINKEVLSMQKTAEETALNGNYGKAKELLGMALSKRPKYKILHSDLKEVQKAIKYQDKLDEIKNYIKKSEFEKANEELAKLKDKMGGEKSPIFNGFQKIINEHDTSLTIGKVKKELNSLSTLDELGGKLLILAPLPEGQASSIKQEIINKIVQVSSDKAEKELLNKRFTDALSTIDQGLQYAQSEKKLIALKTRVEQEKTSFERAEQDRIEQAMEAAAKEDLINKTAAVKVTNLSYEIDRFGDLYLSGSITNTATKQIRFITIYYNIFDEDGNFLKEDYTSVYPYAIDMGGTGFFEDTIYGVYQDVKIEIDNITWYLN